MEMQGEENMRDAQALAYSRDRVLKHKPAKNGIYSFVPPSKCMHNGAPSLWLLDGRYVKLFGGGGWEQANAVAADSSDNVYVGGYATAGLSVGSQSFAGVGMTDAFVFKLDSTGTAVFNTVIGTSNGDEYVSGVAVNTPSSSLYAVGYSNGDGTLTLKTTNYPVTNAEFGNRDVFLVKLDSSTGSPQWVEFFGTTRHDYGYGVACDANSVVAVGKMGSTSLTVDGAVLLGTGTTDGYVVKFDAAGGLKWLVGINSTTGSEQAGGVALDSNGEVYVMGIFSNSLTLGGTTLVTGGVIDVFVAKLDGTTGRFLWATSFGSSNMDYAYGIAYDGLSSSVYVAGSYGGSMTVGSCILPFEGGISDVFLIRLSASSGTVGNAHGGGSSSDDQFNGVAVDATGNLVATGYTYGSSVTFGNMTAAVSNNPYAGMTVGLKVSSI